MVAPARSKTETASITLALISGSIPSTKYSFGRTCATSKSPEIVYAEIRTGVERALKNLNKAKIFTMEKPYRMEVKVKGEEPGSVEIYSHTSDTLEVVMKKFWEKL